MHLANAVLVFSLALAVVGLLSHAILVLGVFFFPPISGFVRGFPEYQKTGFILVPIGFVGLFLFVSKVIVTEDVLDGTEVRSQCKEGKNLHCWWPYMISWRVHTVREQLELYRDVALGGARECFTVSTLFKAVPLADFSCDDIAKEDVHLETVMSPNGEFIGDCLYSCSKMREFKPSAFILELGMIVGGGVFLNGVAEAFGALFSNLNVRGSHSPQELVDIFDMAIRRPGVRFWNICHIPGLFQRHGMGAVKAACDPLVLTGAVFLAVAFTRLQTSMTDIVTCYYILYLCMAVWAFRVSFLYSRSLWREGVDENFVSFDKGGNVVKKPFEIIDWLEMPQRDRFKFLARYIMNIGEAEVNDHRGPKLRVKCIADCRGEDDDKDIQQGALGVALEMAGTIVKVKWDQTEPPGPGNGDTFKNRNLGKVHINKVQSKYLLQQEGEEVLEKELSWIFEAEPRMHIAVAGVPLLDGPPSSRVLRQE